MRAARLALLPLCAALLTACASSGGDGTRLYVLSATASAAAQAAPGPAVVVAAVRIPQYLDRPQLVTRGNGNRVQIAEFDQWAGDLREDLTRTLAENISRLLGSAQVVAAPHAVKAPSAFRVEAEVLAFEQRADGRVRFAARWWLTRGTEQAPIEGTRTVELFGAPLGDKPSIDATVASMSQVYGEFAREVANALRSAPAAKP